MASNEVFRFHLEQLSGLEEITYRSMMGRNILFIIA